MTIYAVQGIISVFLMYILLYLLIILLHILCFSCNYTKYSCTFQSYDNYFMIHYAILQNYLSCNTNVRKDTNA